MRDRVNFVLDVKDMKTGIGCVGSKDGRRSGVILNGEDAGVGLGWGYMGRIEHGLAKLY